MKASSLHLAAIAVAVIFSACEKEATKYSRAYGEEIMFGAVSSGDSDTKAAYSGEETTSGSHTYERIDWQTGDKLRIVCPQASEPTTQYLTDQTSDLYEDYTITSVTAGTGNDAAKSSAGLTHPAGNKGLRWGSASTHYFYSMYPCPSSVSTSVGIYHPSNGSIRATCVIPAAQTYGELEGTKDNDGVYTTDVVATPNPEYLYLIGYATASTSGSDPVQINYNPAFTSFEITVQNAFESQADMTVSSVSLSTSSSTAPLSGTYDVAINESVDKNDIGNLDDSGNIVSMTFDSPVIIKYGKKFTFTLFAQAANNPTELTLKLSDGTKDRTIELKKRKGSDYEWITFNALHKSKLTGLMAPESSSWYINLGGSGSTDVTLEAWKDGGTKDVTEITLASNSLDVWCVENSTTEGDVTTYSYTFHGYASDTTLGTARTEDSILINGEFSSENKPTTSSPLSGEIGKLVTPSVTDPGSTGKYYLVLTYNTTYSSTTPISFTDGLLTTDVIVNHVATNSYAQFELKLHKFTAQ